MPGDSDLPKGYNAGNVAAVYYVAGAIPGNAKLETDLFRMLRLYESLVAAATQTIDLTNELAVIPVKTAEEAKQARWHLRYERNPKLVADAKRIHGYVCEVCKFDFASHYPHASKPFIEAHHKVAFASVVGASTYVDPKKDFAVVCANCHRMLHRVTPPLTVEEPAAEFHSCGSH